MKRFRTIQSLAMVLVLAAAAESRAEDFVDGLSVGAEGSVSNHGAGGEVIGEHRGEHDRVYASIGGFAPFREGRGPRLIGSLGGFYCLGETGANFCFGSTDVLQSNGTHSQAGVSPIGVGFVTGEGGSSMYFAPRYAYIFDHESEIDMHSVGLDVHTDFELVDETLLLQLVGQVAVGFAAEGQSSVPVEREVEDMGYFFRGGAGLRWTPIPNLALHAGVEVSDAIHTDRRDGEIMPTDPAFVGSAGAQWAF